MCAQYGTQRRREKKISGLLTEFQNRPRFREEGRHFQVRGEKLTQVGLQSNRGTQTSRRIERGSWGGERTLSSLEEATP